MKNTATYMNKQITENNNLPHEMYSLFQVFLLPSAWEVADNHGKLILSAEDFLKLCIKNVRERNLSNLREGTHHSRDYFTNLNRAERYRIPTTLMRLNPDLQEERFGIISFWAQKDEPVKNKVYNQRISSVNPDILTCERVKEIYYPYNYRTEKVIDLYRLGKITDVEKEGFYIVHVNDSIIKNCLEAAQE